MHRTVYASDQLRPGRHVRAVLTPQGGALLDLRPRRGRWYTFTPTAAFWWQRIHDGCTVAEASRAVADEYGIPAGQAAADLDPFLVQMLRKRLLVLAIPRRTPRWKR